MRQQKDELKRKRGALDLNSDLELDMDYGNPKADLPAGV